MIYRHLPKLLLILIWIIPVKVRASSVLDSCQEAIHIVTQASSENSVTLADYDLDDVTSVRCSPRPKQRERFVIELSFSDNDYQIFALVNIESRVVEDLSEGRRCREKCY